MSDSNIISNFIDFISNNFIALAAFILSIISFCRSEKYRQIENRLNKLEIKKHEKKKIETKKANLTAEYKKSKDEDISGYLIIKNEGEAIAKKIKIRKTKGEGIEVVHEKKLQAKQLDPNKNIRIEIIQDYDADSKMTLKLFWDDHYEENRKKEREVVL